MKRRFLCLLLCAVLLLCAACAAPAEMPPGDDGALDEAGPVVEGDLQYVPGTYTASAQGFGGEVTVTVEVDGSKILNVAAEGPGETQGIGSRAIEELPGLLLEAQSAETDGIAGCTYTSKAVLSAFEAALGQASGEGREESAEAVALKMAPGVYEASAAGYSKTRPVNVSVTVTDYAVTKIEVGENKENVGILQSVTDLLIPRIIEHQSVRVDAITGATASSLAVSAAVEDCIAQALAAAGTDPSAIEYFYRTETPEPSAETIEVGVVVVGMGGSGASAAMMAADTQSALGEEVSVLAIEKAGKFGGTSCNTSVMLAFDSHITEELYNNGERYFDSALCDAELRAAAELTEFQEMGWKKILEESGNTLDWLISHGFYFGEPKPGLAGTLPNSFEYNGSGGEKSLAVAYSYFENMVEDYTELGGEYLLETEGVGLLYDEATNTVTGVRAINHVTGVEYEIHADAVVLATGGFGANDAMEEELYEGSQTGAYRHDISMMQNDGKMMQAALDIGAATAGFEDCLTGVIWNIGVPNRLTTYDIIWEEGTYDLFRDDTGAWSYNDIPEMMVNDWTGVFLNAEGERFVNEAGIWAGKYNNGSLYYTLWSKSSLDRLNESGFANNFSGNFLTTSSMTSGIFPLNTGILEMGTDVYEIMEECVRTGNALKADTLEELAELAGMDPAVLAGTVERYNAACAAGVDEEFGKDPAFLFPVGEEGPYYLLLAMPRAYTSGGGLYVNDKLQVLSAEDETTPIAGLFAAGTDCLGATAPFYYGGEYLSWAFVSGRGAGRSAARYAAGLDLEYELETIEVGGLMVTGGDSSSADDPDTPMGFLRDENEA